MGIHIEKIQTHLDAGVWLVGLFPAPPYRLPDVSVVLPRVFERVWQGYARRFQNLWNVTKEHYILMPILTIAVIGIAIASAPIGTALTVTAIGLTAIKGAHAVFTDSPEDFGETLADVTLLLGGWALGRAGGAIIGKSGEAGGGTNGGAALHLVDEVAAGILMTKQFLQQ